jgi:hypothetical protein
MRTDLSAREKERLENIVMLITSRRKQCLRAEDAARFDKSIGLSLPNLQQIADKASY